MLRSPDDTGGAGAPSATSMAERVRAASDRREPAAVVAALLAIAVELKICDAAGVIAGHTDRPPVSVVATDELAAAADRFQCHTASGPAIEALTSGVPVVVADLRAARGHGDGLAAVGALLALPLDPERGSGVLTLYRRTPRSFSADELAAAGELAAHLCVTLRHQAAVGTLLQAIASRTVIGQAQGILMERHRLTAAEAFAVLTRCSQDRNVKLAVLADELTTTGRLAGLRRLDRT